jgi:hypothetical protein
MGQAGQGITSAFPQTGRTIAERSDRWEKKRLRVPLSTSSVSLRKPGSFGDGISRRGCCRSGVPDRRLDLTRSPLPLLAEIVSCLLGALFSLSLTLSGPDIATLTAMAGFFFVMWTFCNVICFLRSAFVCSTESVSEEPWDLRHETFCPQHPPIVGCGRYGEAGSAGSRLASFLKAKEGSIQGCPVSLGCWPRHSSCWRKIPIAAGVAQSSAQTIPCAALEL